ncbi:MarR family transcriptional regulator [Paracraurococcus ruber]|nr:MarR family transcriptional regulator [Paracraurococcus ruber]
MPGDGRPPRRAAPAAGRRRARPGADARPDRLPARGAARCAGRGADPALARGIAYHAWVTQASPPQDPPLFALLNEIGIIEQLARNRFDAAQADGLLLSHFVLLNHLVRVQDGAAPARIARALQVAKGAVTNTVQRLEDRGLVRVEPDPADGRGRRVWLTPAGRARRQQAVRAAVEAFSGLAALLPEARIAALLPELRAIRQALDAARDAEG